MGGNAGISALERAIERLAAPRAGVASGASAARGVALRDYGRRSRLGALLDAVDTTVLPQLLRLTNGVGETLDLAAGNRRLLSVRPGPGASLPAQDLEPGDGAGLQRLGTALASFASLGRDLRLAPQPAPLPAGGLPRGVAASELARLWEVEIVPADIDTPPDILDRTLGDTGAAIRAWSFSVDGRSAGEGDAEARAGLTRILDVLERQGPPLEEGTVLALDGAQSGSGHGTVLMRQDGVSLAFATAPEATDRVAGLLQEIRLGWA